MRDKILWGALVVLTVGAWLVLANTGWLPGERLYFLLPPVVIAGWILARKVDPEFRRTLPRRVLREASGLLAVTAAIGFVHVGRYVWFAQFTWEQARPLLPWTELGVLIYTLLCARLIFGGGYALCSAAFQGLDRIVFGLSLSANVPGENAPRERFVIVRRGLREVMPACALLVALMPLFLAISYLYRLKIPGPAFPSAALGRTHEEVTLVADDGTRLAAWWIPARSGPSPRTILFCHGLSGNRAQAINFLKLADALDANLLTFDFRGHGHSAGRTVCYGAYAYRDVLAALKYLRTEKAESSKVVLGLGISMGTSCLAQGAARAEPPFDALILDSAFSSLDEMSWHILRKLPNGVAAYLQTCGMSLACWHAGTNLSGIRTDEVVQQVRAPVLCIHAEEDQVVPLALGRKVYEAAREPRQWWSASAPQPAHTGLMRVDPARYIERARALLTTSPTTPTAAAAETETETDFARDTSSSGREPGTARVQEAGLRVIPPPQDQRDEVPAERD